MKNLKEVITNNYHMNKKELENDFDNALNTNTTFKKIVTKLKLPKEYLINYTTKLEDTSKELDNCKNCKKLSNCKNSYQGYVYYPEILNDNLVFDYVPCKYKKEQMEQDKYKDNIYIYELPKEIKEASMKNIDLDDPKRFEIIKWYKNHLI